MAPVDTMERRLQHLSDREVAEIAQLSSLEAYDELVHRFRDAVLLVAGQILGSREAAEDVAQEAFLLAFQRLPQLQDPGKFAGWLYTITRHRAWRVARWESRIEATDCSTLDHLLISQHNSCAPGPLDALLHAETQASIQALLAGLSPELQIVIHLFYYEQWSAARISAFLSLPLSTVKWRLHAGKQQLSGHIAELLKEGIHVRTRSKKRGATSAQSAAENGGARRACGADGQLRKRDPQLREALQCDCGAS